MNLALNWREIINSYYPRWLISEAAGERRAISKLYRRENRVDGCEWDSGGASLERGGVNF